MILCFLLHFFEENLLLKGVMFSLTLVIFTSLSMFDIIISHFKKIEKSTFFFYGWMFVILFFLLFFLALYTNYTIVSSYFGLNKSMIDKDIMIVALDNETLNSGKYKKYQDINRCDYTTLLNNILAGNPKAVILDTVLYQTAINETCASDFTDILAKNPKVIVGMEYNTSTKMLYTNLLENTIYSGSIGITNTLSYTSFNLFKWSLADYRNRVHLYKQSEKPLLPLGIEAYQLTHNLNKPIITPTALIFNSGTQIPIDE